MARTAKRSGFTLVEVLVILSILAALAAVLVPTVSNQVRKADIGRVTGDLTNLRTGIEAFLVDVHRYPADIEDLVYPLQASPTDVDINGNPYPAGLRNRWEGPYVDRAITDDGSLETGFAGRIQDNFSSVDLDGLGVDYVEVLILGIAQPEFDEIDAQFDEDNGAASGRLRWGTDGTTDTTYYYALPIN